MLLQAMGRGNGNIQTNTSSGIELDDYAPAGTSASTRVETIPTPDRRKNGHPSPLVGDATARSSRIKFHQLRAWWANNICLSVIHSWEGNNAHSHNPRDYLALERTFLAHVRTASALVSFGVALLQLYRLKQVDSRAGLALGAVCACGGIIIVFTGGWRYFLLQKRLAGRKAVAGGPGAWVGGLFILGVISAVLIVVLAEA
ncbi:MAG: hypothetical protein Q9186_002886 [Xanthomendoza sp. 1 TL-2023]